MKVLITGADGFIGSLLLKRIESEGWSVVQFSGDIPGKGRVLIVEHPHDLYSIYSGVEQPLKSAGEATKANEQLATVGSQIYFEIRSRNLAIDPLKWLQ